VCRPEIQRDLFLGGALLENAELGELHTNRVSGWRMKWMSVLRASAIGLLIACLVHMLLLAILYSQQWSIPWLPDWAPILLSALVGLSVPLRKFRSIGVIVSVIFVPTAVTVLTILSLFVGCRLFGDCL